MICHIDHCTGFYLYQLLVGFKEYLVPRSHFSFGEYLVRGEQLHILAVEPVSERVGSCFEIGQPALFGFLYPRVVIAVSVEYDTLVLLDDLLYQIVESGVEILLAFKRVRKLTQLLGYRCVEYHVAARNRCRRAEHTELKLVSCKGEGRCPVPVRCILGELRQNVNADLQKLLFLSAVGDILFYSFEYLRQLLAQKYRYNGGRRFVSSEPVIVSGARHGYPEQILIIVNRLYHGT